MISDRELRALRSAGSMGPLSYAGWAMVFGLFLDRKVTVEEVEDAIPRLNGPPAPGTTFADLGPRSSTPAWTGRPMGASGDPTPDS